MITYLLDSDVLISFFKKRSEFVNLLLKLKEKGELSVSILSISELRSGWNDKDAQFYLPRLYNIVKVQEITLKIAEMAGKFRYVYKLRGRSLPTIDTLIAATAVLNNCQLVTGNKKDYPMKNLKLYSEKE